jgi:hypothetical protein
MRRVKLDEYDLDTIRSLQIIFENTMKIKVREDDFINLILKTMH